jgi:hypothetical protein
MNSRRRSLNRTVLLVFAPLLILTGVSGLVLPPGAGLMSDAPAYDLFHICFGLLGLGLLYGRSDRGIRMFNIVFGAVDLYQVCADWAGWFPGEYFRWRPADDVVHIVVGIGLIAVGLYGWSRSRRPGMDIGAT